MQISKYRGRQHFSDFRGAGAGVGLGFWGALGFGGGSGFSQAKKNPSWLDWDSLVLLSA